MNNLPYFLDTCPNYIKNKFMYVKFNTFDKILKQNEDPNFVYIIKKGKVKVYSLTPTGIKYLERTYCENDLARRPEDNFPEDRRITLRKRIGMQSEVCYNGLVYYIG